MKAPLALLFFIFLALPHFSSADSLNSSASESCLIGLSQGRNRLKVNLPIKALRLLNDGLKTHAARLQEKSLGLLVDYSKNSVNERSFLIDFAACDIVSGDYVIHGGAYRQGDGYAFDGDPDRDGMLDTCKNKKGNRTNMTRPGLALTAGCHRTQQTGWPLVKGDCHGVKLIGLEKTNTDIYASGVVLHEHIAIPNDDSIKPMGQGCPAYSKGKLKDLLKHGLFEGALVLVYAPQCSTPVPVQTENVLE